jgi:hypothetical protein
MVKGLSLIEMHNARAMNPVLMLGCCVVVLIGCRGEESFCPAPTVEVDPEVIPIGDNDTTVTVTIENPNPDNGREVLTELYADSGTFDDPSALETTYTCAHDVTGEVEICADVAYGPPIGPGPGSASEVVAAAVEYLRAPHAYFVRPEDCLETACTTVVCPAEKNQCPVIDDLEVEPEVIMEGETAIVRVTAEDPDDNPAPLVTTLTATAGTFEDRYAPETTFTCDPSVGGPIEICVDASDGDLTCDVKRCLIVQCPGAPPDNVCPVIADLSSDPLVIPPNERQSVVEVDAFDPDAVNPEPLLTTFSASAGTFEDRNASATLFTCGAPGPTEICVKASDGDFDCDNDRCITVQCPSTVPDNLCPKLYVLNALPSDLRNEGVSFTEIQVRAEDPGADGPLPLTTTLYAIRGIFDDIHAEDTLYHCERGGLMEVCVDATDGACVKTLCIDVWCPDIP